MITGNIWDKEYFDLHTTGFAGFFMCATKMYSWKWLENFKLIKRHIKTVIGYITHDFWFERVLKRSIKHTSEKNILLTFLKEWEEVFDKSGQHTRFFSQELTWMRCSTDTNFELHNSRSRFGVWRKQLIRLLVREDIGDCLRMMNVFKCLY